MKVVTDSSPLISLAVLDLLELVNVLFTEIIVPSEVFQEIEASKDKRESAKIKEFIKDRIRSPKSIKPLKDKLGKGETEAINLSLEMNVDLLIIDDKRARNAAESYNIKCIGTLGLLTLAKKKGFIEELREYFIRLIENKRYLSIDLLNRVLQVNQEKPL